MNKNDFTNNLEKEILDLIVNNFKRPEFITTHEKENREYFKKSINEFKEKLNDTQKQNLESLFEIDSMIQDTENFYGILYGMKFFSTVFEIMNNPIKTLEFYESKSTPASKIYPMK